MAKKIPGHDLLLDRGSRGSLWLADDHLLVIETACFLLCYRETYRRLDYANIHAVMQAPTHRSTWQLIGLLLMLAFFGLMTLIGAAEDGVGPALVIFSPMALLSLVLLIVHLRMGPSATVSVLTAVRAWPLTMVTRRKQAEKVLAALSARCAEAQQPLAVPATPAAASAETPAPAGLETPAMSATPPEIKSATHPIALPAWLCILTFAVLIAGEAMWNAVPASILMMLFGFAGFTMLIIAFSRGGGVSGVGGRGLFTSALVSLGIDLVAGWIICMVGMMGDIVVGGNNPMQPPSMLKGLAGFPSEVPSTGALVLFALALITAVPAMLGLLAVSRQHQLKRQSDASPTEPTAS